MKKLTHNETDSILKNILGKKLHQIGELGLERSIMKALLDLLPISGLSFELSAVCISQVNMPHTVTFQN